MTKLFRLYCLQLSILFVFIGCVKTNLNVQEKTADLKSAYKEYSTLCKRFPYPDKIYVDQCFEFDCNANLFSLWDKNCKEIISAKDMLEKHGYYFLNRTDGGTQTILEFDKDLSIIKNLK